MGRRPRFRWVELVLWSAGVCLLGAALGETIIRWNHQAKQTRALERGSAVAAPVQPIPAPVANAVSAPAPVPRPVENVVPAVKRRGTANPRPKETAVDLEGVFARIEIPRLGVKAIVEEGSDDKTLARAVGLVEGSARPGEGGNVVMAGHRDTFFRPLRRIKVNDRIRVTVPPHTYEYEVTSLRVVSPDETSVLASRGVEELTLVTCYPFRFIGPAPERFIVTAAAVRDPTHRPAIRFAGNGRR